MKMVGWAENRGLGRGRGPAGGRAAGWTGTVEIPVPNGVGARQEGEGRSSEMDKRMRLSISPGRSGRSGLRATIDTGKRIATAWWARARRAPEPERAMAHYFNRALTGGL